MKYTCLLFSVLFFSLLITSCDSDPDELVIKDTRVVLNPEETKSIPIVSGNGKYKLEILDNSIIEAHVQKGKIYITGKNRGMTSINVKDSESKTEQIKVLVTDVEIYLDNYYSTVLPGENDTINAYMGNGDYKAFAYSPEIAGVEIEEDNIIIKGKKEGITSVLVSDKYNKQRVIEVMVLPEHYKDIINDPTSRIVWEGVEEEYFETKEYHIGYYTLGWMGYPSKDYYRVQFDNYSLGSNSVYKIFDIMSWDGEKYMCLELDRLTVLKKNEAVWFEFEKDGKTGYAVSDKWGMGNFPVGIVLW